MEFFRRFSSKPSPKQVAKDRLKLILIHDRGNISHETVEKIKLEILQVIAKYIEINPDDVEIAVSKTDDVDGNNPSLIANIPIKNIK